MRALSLLLVAAMVFALPLAGPGQEKKGQTTTLTHIGGRTLEQWLADLKLKDNSKRENALRTILLFGPDRAYAALPVVMDLMKKHPTAGQLDISIRVHSCIFLGVVLGGYPEADAKVVKDAVTLLKRYAGDTQAIVRYRAVQALGRIGPPAREALPEILAALKDSGTWEVKHAAAEALGRVAFDRKSGPPLNVLNGLFTALGDINSQVRLGAIQSLTWLGSPADPKLKLALLEELDKLTKADPEPTVQLWAQMAFMSAAHEFHKTRLDAIAKYLRHEDVAARVQAAQALGTIGKDAKEVVPALIGALKDEEPLVAGWAIWALSRMERSALGALAALQTIAKDSKQPEPLRRAAEEAIETITGKKKAE